MADRGNEKKNLNAFIRSIMIPIIAKSIFRVQEMMLGKSSFTILNELN